MFDLIAITETKQQIEKDFITNVDINGYHLYTQPSLKEQQEELQFMHYIHKI